MLQGGGGGQLAGTLMYRNPNLIQVGGGAEEGSSWNCRSCFETLIAHRMCECVCVCGGGGGTDEGGSLH